MFGLAHVNVVNFSNLAFVATLVDTNNKKHQTTACVGSIFFCERVVNVWNSLTVDVSFDSFYWFRCSIMRINMYFMRVINIVKVN